MFNKKDCLFLNKIFLKIRKIKFYYKNNKYIYFNDKN